MPKIDLNVSTRPFRNVWPLAVFFGVLTLLAVVFTLFNLYLAGTRWIENRSYYSELHRRKAAIRELETATETVESRLLKLNREHLRRTSSFTNELIQRRTFSWSLLLTRLEKILPDDVVMTAITPKISGEVITIRLECIAKRQDDGLEFINRLEQSPAFFDVFPENEGQEEILTYGRGLRYTLVTSYQEVGEQEGQGEIASPEAAL